MDNTITKKVVDFPTKSPTKPMSRIEPMAKAIYWLSLVFGSSLLLFQPLFWYLSFSYGIISLVAAGFCFIFFLVAAQYNHAKDFEKRQVSVINQMQTRLSHYKEVMSNSKELISEFDSYGNLVFANNAFINSTGIKFEKDQTTHFDDLIPKWLLSSQQEFFRTQQLEKIRETQSEVPIIGNGGAVIWIEQRNKMLFDSLGNLVKTTCIGRDITHQKNTEKTLIEAKEAAIKSSLVKAQFLSSMSHEIRTPMNAVIGLIYLMLQEEPRPDQKAHLETLKFSAENLLELINDILDFSKIEAGKIEINAIDFSLEEIIKNINHGFGTGAAEKGIGLSLNYDERLPSMLIGDPLRLSQIMNNLINNAIKFTDEGGINISIKMKEERNSEVDIFFSVEDTGIGIPSDKLKTIFEDFSQVDNANLRQGTGLGLSITKELLKLQNSQIEVESTFGEGSIFYFTLTFKKSFIREEKLDSVLIHDCGTSCKNNSLEGMKVLLVEDNKINQKVTKKFLTKWGIETTIADNGKIALDIVQINDYDLVLMDMQMPVMNGIESTKAIRALGGKFKKLPIIALTASAVLDMKRNAIQAGLNGFITKPFTPDILYAKVASCYKKEAVRTQRAVSV